VCYFIQRFTVVYLVYLILISFLPCFAAFCSTLRSEAVNCLSCETCVLIVVGLDSEPVTVHSMTTYLMKTIASRRRHRRHRENTSPQRNTRNVTTSRHLVATIGTNMEIPRVIHATKTNRKNPDTKNIIAHVRPMIAKRLFNNSFV